MEKIKGLAIELDLDHLSVDRGLKGLKDNIKTVNSEMRKNMSAFDRSDRSVAKYETSLMGLNKKLEVQKVAVAEAKKEHEAMVDEYGHGSKEAEKAAREYNNQAASLNNLERYIERTKDELVKFQREQRISNSTWTKMGDKLESYGGKLKGIGGEMNDVGSKMTKRITLPAFTAAAAVGGIFTAFGWGRLVSLDNAQAKLKGLGYTMEDVERITLDVKEAVTGTTMTMAEGTDVAAGGLAAGVKEGKELEKYIKRVGNAAIGSNRPIDEMAVIFSRIEGNGKLMTQELNSIEMGMPGFSKTLAKHLDVPIDKLREMVTNGEVSAKDFNKVMDGFAGDMAKEYAKTWDGMVSNTKANIGIIGESFLKGVFQDGKKSLADFIELLKSPEIKRRAEEMGEVARKSFGKMKDSIVDVVNWYKDLDDGQKTMIKRLGLVAIAGGPVLQVVGKLTSGFGGMLSAVGKLSKAIGLSKGVGLLSALSSLGPAAIPAVAVAGLATVATGAYLLTKRQNKLKEVNLDLAESFMDKSNDLESAIGTYDRLIDKTDLTHDELMKVYDANQILNESINPAEIEEYTGKFDDWIKKSGLTKDEMLELLEANDDIIDQTPNMKTAFSERGNAMVDSTDQAKDYVSVLEDMAIQEIRVQKRRLEDDWEDNLEEQVKKQEEILELEKNIGVMEEHRNTSKEDALVMMEENERLMNSGLLTEGEYNALFDENNALSQIAYDLYNETYAKSLDKLDTEKEELEVLREQENQLQEIHYDMADILLSSVGINEEGKEGLAQLDENISKNREQLSELDGILEKEGELTEKQQDKYDKLTLQNDEYEKIKGKIFDETGLYTDLNRLVDDKLNLLKESDSAALKELETTAEINVEEGNIVKQIQNKNSEIDESISKLEKEKDKQGANKDEINEQIDKLELKKITNNEVIKQALQEAGVWDEVKDKIKEGTTEESKKGDEIDKTTGKVEEQEKKEEDLNRKKAESIRAEKGLGDQIDDSNKKTDKGIEKEKARTKEAGKDVDKTVAVVATGIATLNRQATEKKTKHVGVAATGLAKMNREVSAPISKTVNLSVRGGAALGVVGALYAKGTPPGGHPGGHAILGDGGGSELTTLPSGQQFLSASTATLYPNLPKGTHVMPHRETKRILKSVPRYADGTRGWLNSLGNSEFARLLLANDRSESNVVIREDREGNDNSLLQLLLNAMLKQNEILMQLLAKDNNTYLDSRQLEPAITEIQERNKRIEKSFS